MPKQATIILRWVAASVLGAAIVFAAYYVITNPQQAGRELGMATSRQPERITELYFANPEVLPSSISPSPRELTVAFTIHNLESQTIDYTYRVSYADSQTTVDVPDGRVTLRDGQSQTITQPISIPAGTSRGEVSIQLLNKSQRIHYWLERL